MPAPYKISKSERVGEDMAPLTAGTHDLTAQSGKPERCVRRVMCLAATTFTVLQNSKGVNCAPAAAFPEGSVIDGDVSAITFTGGPVLVLW
jgi:hypothetical protein